MAAPIGADATNGGRPVDARSHFYAAADRQYLSALQMHAKPEFDAYLRMSGTIFGREDGALDRRTRELIAVAVAVASQCPYCIQSHTKNALHLGATEAAVAEASMVAVAIGAGSAATHGAMAMRLFEDASIERSHHS
jgi:AhpD family alkylhydroperoxidase